MACGCQLPIEIVIGGRDVSAQVEAGGTFSNVDPGGYEAATFSFPDDIGVRRGMPVRVTAGLETAWAGRVQRVGRKLAGGSGVTVSCEGYGAAFRETLVREIWIDRDLSHWGSAPAAYQAARILLNFQPQQMDLMVDPESGQPGFKAQFEDLAQGAGPVDVILKEMWYDAQGIPIGSVFYGFDHIVNMGGSWINRLLLASDDSHSAVNIGTDHVATDAPNQMLTASGVAKVWAVFQTLFNGVFTGRDTWASRWYNIAVVGQHGLPIRTGNDTGGFYPSDIARDVLRRVQGIRAGTIETASGLVVGHAVALDPTAAEQIMSEQALLAGGWHWGTWAAPSILDDTPVFDFRALPSGATCHVARRDCDDLQLEEDISRLFNRADVSFTLGGGSRRVVTITRPVPELEVPRTLPADLGEGTQAEAETYGQFLLALAERAARASGTAELAAPVGTPSGGEKPAYLLKSGIDKLKVTDLPDLPLFAGGRDEFHLKRVEGVLGEDGVRTRLELGLGADLVEVLHARLQLQTDIATFGR